MDQKNLYAILGVDSTANESEIKKGYRKRALACHPDKNPNDPKAAEEFLLLTKALEVLLDASAKAAYDRVLRSKEQAILKSKERDAKRQKFVDDLEFREREAAARKLDEEKFKSECDRLRKDGAKLVQEEQERLRKQILEELLSQKKNYSEGQFCVKLKWKINPNDSDNGGYDKESLHRILSKHGEISALILSEKKKGSALVEYKTSKAAESAVNYELGFINNPLKLKLMGNKQEKSQSMNYQVNPNSGQSFGSGNKQLFPSTKVSSNARNNPFAQKLSFSSAPDILNMKRPIDDETETIQSFNDLEQTVLNDLKRAEERKRLIEAMQAEDEQPS